MTMKTQPRPESAFARRALTPAHAANDVDVEHALQPPCDELVEQACQLIAGGGVRCIDDGFGRGAPVRPIEHPAVQVKVEIPRRAESPDERHRACIGSTSSQARPLDRRPRDDPMQDAQHRCAQLEGRCKQDGSILAARTNRLGNARESR
jgi:hypothetical protein